MELTKLKADQIKQNKTDKKRKEKDMTFNDIDCKTLYKKRKIVSLNIQ
jgi:hypothetical protein